MDNLIAKWKTTMEAQKSRHKQRAFSADRPETELTESEYITLQAQKIIDIIAPNQELPPRDL